MKSLFAEAFGMSKNLSEITGMLIQMQRPVSSPNGRPKHERNMDIDTDKSSLWEQELNYAGGEKCLNTR